MVTRWNIKEHYVAGEFAGYVVVTGDKYEDVICCGIGADQRNDAVLIASAPALKAECDRLREALQEIKHVPCRKEGGMYDSDGDWYVNECSSCRRMHDIAREALKGGWDVEKDS